MQEGAKKDVERCFGIIQNPFRLWQMDIIYEIMTAYVIFHNIIIEDEKDCNFESLFDLANVGQL